MNWMDHRFSHRWAGSDFAVVEPPSGEYVRVVYLDYEEKPFGKRVYKSLCTLLTPKSELGPRWQKRVTVIRQRFQAEK